MSVFKESDAWMLVTLDGDPRGELRCEYCGKDVIGGERGWLTWIGDYESTDVMFHHEACVRNSERCPACNGTGYVKVGFADLRQLMTGLGPRSERCQKCSGNGWISVAAGGSART